MNKKREIYLVFDNSFEMQKKQKELISICTTKEKAEELVLDYLIKKFPGDPNMKTLWEYEELDRERLSYKDSFIRIKKIEEELDTLRFDPSELD